MDWYWVTEQPSSSRALSASCSADWSRPVRGASGPGRNRFQRWGDRPALLLRNDSYSTAVDPLRRRAVRGRMHVCIDDPFDQQRPLVLIDKFRRPIQDDSDWWKRVFRGNVDQEPLAVGGDGVAPPSTDAPSREVGRSEQRLRDSCLKRSSACDRYRHHLSVSSDIEELLVIAPPDRVLSAVCWDLPLTAGIRKRLKLETR